MAQAANAGNCGVPVKTRTGWENRAKETAADTGKPASDLPGAIRAANCALLASTKINWASKAKGIAVGIARLAEAANLDEGRHRGPDYLIRALPAGREAGTRLTQLNADPSKVVLAFDCQPNF